MYAFIHHCFPIHCFGCRIADTMLVFEVSEKSILTPVHHPGSNVTEWVDTTFPFSLNRTCSERSTSLIHLLYLSLGSSFHFVILVTLHTTVSVCVCVVWLTAVSSPPMGVVALWSARQNVDVELLSFMHIRLTCSETGVSQGVCPLLCLVESNLATTHTHQHWQHTYISLSLCPVTAGVICKMSLKSVTNSS